MANVVTVTVRTYSLNGQFIKTEPGENKELQAKFSERIGNLPNQLLGTHEAVFDVRVLNEEVIVFFVPEFISESLVDELIGRVLDDAYEQGILTLPPHPFSTTKKRVSHQEQISDKRMLQKYVDALGKLIIKDARTTFSDRHGRTRKRAAMRVREAAALLQNALPY